MIEVQTIGNATLVAYDKLPILSTDPWMGGDHLPKTGIFICPTQNSWLRILAGLQKLYLGEKIITQKFFRNAGESGHAAHHEIPMDREKIPEERWTKGEYPILSGAHSIYSTDIFRRKRYWDGIRDWAIAHNLSDNCNEFIRDLKTNEKQYLFYNNQNKNYYTRGFGVRGHIVQCPDKFDIYYGEDNFSIATENFIKNGLVQEDLWPSLFLYNNIWTGWKIDKENKELLYLPRSKKFPPKKFPLV